MLGRRATPPVAWRVAVAVVGVVALPVACASDDPDETWDEFVESADYVGRFDVSGAPDGYYAEARTAPGVVGFEVWSDPGGKKQRLWLDGSAGWWGVLTGPSPAVVFGFADRQTAQVVVSTNGTEESMEPTWELHGARLDAGVWAVAIAVEADVEVIIQQVDADGIEVASDTFTLTSESIEFQDCVDRWLSKPSVPSTLPC